MIAIGAPTVFSASLTACATVLDGIVHERLIEQADFLVIGLQAGLDDLLEHMRRLAGVLLGEHVLFARDHRGIDRRGVERDRAAAAICIAIWRPSAASASVLAGRFQRDDHADAAEAVGDLAVDVMADRAVRATCRPAARRSVMFSPMVAIALAIASATVPPPG